MKKPYVAVMVRPDVKKLLLTECRIEFLKQNPDFEGMNLTHDFLLRRVIRYYLET